MPAACGGGGGGGSGGGGEPCHTAGGISAKGQQEWREEEFCKYWVRPSVALGGLSPSVMDRTRVTLKVTSNPCGLCPSPSPTPALPERQLPPPSLAFLQANYNKYSNL